MTFPVQDVTVAAVLFLGMTLASQFAARNVDSVLCPATDPTCSQSHVRLFIETYLQFGITTLANLYAIGSNGFYMTRSCSLARDVSDRVPIRSNLKQFMSSVGGAFSFQGGALSLIGASFSGLELLFNASQPHVGLRVLVVCGWALMAAGFFLLTDVFLTTDSGAGVAPGIPGVNALNAQAPAVEAEVVIVLAEPVHEQP